jgi:7-carboxy-7-deazaguanine synthase
MGSNNTLEISEIFSSLQGESTFAGLPCVFIRLSGCNLHCSYCDSRYAIEERGRIMTVDEVLGSITDYPGFLVEITGGEPLLQQNVYDLIEKLLMQGKTVLIETNGSLDIAAIPIEATIIMDIKCPGSGSPSLHPDNLNTIRRRASLRPGSTEIKFVLSSLDDYTWAKDMVLVNAIPCFAPVLFSPVRDLLPVKDLAEAILRDRLQVRLQLQLHTIIWPEKSRGV